ncbi:MAG: translation elongation factor Ts [Bacilli bacterium]
MSSQIEFIKILRERTGAGMMDCKHALDEVNNDVEKAIDWLREKGIAKAAKKASRIAAEGLTIVKFCEECKKALVLEINCETDFVAKSDAFKALMEESAKIVMHAEAKSVEECKTLTSDLFNNALIKLGEKLDLRRFEIVHILDGQSIGTYMHMGGKISTLVVLEKENAELAKGIAMTIAANSPTYIIADEIPSEVKAKETSIQLEAAKNDEKLKDKPLQALEKIIEGKVNKALADQVLVKQDYVLDPSKTIEQMLKETGNKVVKFIRYQVGEGIEKRCEDFSQEVLNQTK